MSVIMHGDLTRQAIPGDIIIVSGIFSVMPVTGFRAIKAGLTANVHVEATHIEKLKMNYTEFKPNPETIARVTQLAEDPNIYDLLALSVAPEIYGHEDVKKALLLLLVGAPTLNVRDGLKIRGVFPAPQG